MGNMLESDASSSDVEIEEVPGKPKERTAGDGMESDITINLPTVNGTSSPARGNIVKDSSSAKLNSETSPVQIKHFVHDKNDNIGKVFESEGQDSVAKLDGISLSTASSIAGKSLSPRSLPSRDLLIPVKPPKLDNNLAGSSGKSPLTQANVKQKAPKFVPYEPYSGATRPIITSQGHARKPSDSSCSIVSQASTISDSHTDATTDHCKGNESNFNATGGDLSPHHQTQSLSKHLTNKSGTSHYHRDHASTTLMKERLKMAEKEICDLQSENARLKKLFVDSMAGGSAPISTGIGAADGNSTSSLGQNANIVRHGNKECVDNLNDELEVSRSKFLSSCVLVDQLTTTNHHLNGTINEAAEIIRDLKNTASLTQEQYEHINGWLRKTNQTSYSSFLEPDSNFSQDYLDSN